MARLKSGHNFQVHMKIHLGNVQNPNFKKRALLGSMLVADRELFPCFHLVHTGGWEQTVQPLPTREGSQKSFQ